MAYATIGAHRLLYNLDGTKVGYNNSQGSFSSGLTGYLTQTEMNNLQNETAFYTGSSTQRCFWFFFPEKRDITHIIFAYSYANSGYYNSIKSLQGSNDTTNGMDGTWVDFSIPSGSTVNISNSLFWRSPVALTVPTGGNSFKVLRMAIYNSSITNVSDIHTVNIYGRKSAGETPNDIVFVKADGTTEYTGLHEYGSTMEGKTYTTDMYIKNTSAVLSANNISVTLGGTNASNVTLSLDGTTYASSLTVTSLAPNTQQVIHVKTTIEKPATSLNPRNAYIRTTVSSWT